MNDVSRPSRDRVWDGLLDIKRSVRYFHRLAQHFQYWHKVLVAVVSLGAFLTAFIEITDPSPLWPAIISSLLVVAISVWSMVVNYQEKARQATEFETGLANLSPQWERLWSKVDDLDDEDLEHQRATLIEKQNEITKTLASDLPERKRINQQCAEETYQNIQGEYRLNESG